MQRFGFRIQVPKLGRIALLLCALSVAAPARATDPAAEPIALVLHSESAELSFDALALALGKELNVPTVASGSPSSASARGVLTVTYHPQTKELVVSYSDAARGTVTRVVPAPDRESEVPELTALVAGNLVRDQASEFLPVRVTPVTAVAQPSMLTSPSEIPPNDEPPTKPPIHRLGNASLFYPLATNMNEPELTTNFDVNLFYGHIGALDGLSVGMVSTVTGAVQGLQLSALTNLVGGPVRAAQLSALFNQSLSVEGAQVALLNRTQGSMHGLQAGALNFAGSSQGLQLSGVNIAGDLEGVQIGIVNVGKRVRGVQLGLVNIADDVDGLPIGLISVSKKGGVHPVVWSSNTTYGNLGVKLATRYTYTMLAGAMHDDGAHNSYGAGFTIGGSIPVRERIAAEIDLQALHLFADGKCIQQGFPASVAPYTIPRNSSQAGAGGPNGACLSEGDIGEGTSNTAPRKEGFTSASSRAFDPSLAKLRALLRFELVSHLSLFVGTGVTGRVTYPVVNGDTEVQFRLLPEVFGGVQL